MFTPHIYLEPLGTPLRWQDETSGTLKEAVKAFLEHGVDRSKPFSAAQFECVADYFDYYINAPCWCLETAETDRLAMLKESILEAKTVDELGNWIIGCLEIGLDPL